MQAIHQARQAYQCGNYPQSISLYTSILLTNPSNSDCYLQRGSVYYTMDQYQKCILDCKKAQQQGCLRQPTYVLLAHCYRKLKQLVQCKNILKLGLQQHPESKKLKDLLKEVEEKEIVADQEEYMERVLEKMCMHPKVRGYLKEESFLTKLEIMIRSPSMVNSLAKADPRILQAYDAMMLAEEE